MRIVRTARKYIAFVIAFFATQALHAQVIGKLVDEKNIPVKLANVALLRWDSIPVTGTTSDSAGLFSIKIPIAGRYTIRFSSLGFAVKKTEAFDADGSAFRKDLGTITLEASISQLNEVSVLAMRPTITQLADKMVVSVEGTAMAAGTTAFDVLSKSPGVFVDQDGNIQLNGRQGVTVMLDGKLTYLSVRDLRAMLEAMPAENIKNIEIITNPSAKYDAEGTSGILNITLKKNARQGMNGNIHMAVNQNGKQLGYSAGIVINHKTGKWNSSGFMDYNHRVGGREATFTRVFYGIQQTTYFNQEATGNNLSRGPSLRFSTDYSINDRHSIGMTASTMHRLGENDFLTDTYIGANAHNPSQYIDADNISNSRYNNYTANLHYTGKLDTLGKTLSADLDYVRMRNHADSWFYNYFTTLGSQQMVSDFLYTRVPNGFEIYAGKIDYIKPFSQGRKMEMGIKASRVVSDNNSQFYFNNNGLVPDMQRTNHFNYAENIYAGYINWSSKLSGKLTLQAGLRAENTVSTGRSFTTGQVTGRNYFNLFPSLFLQQNVSADYQVNYSYSRRLTRPNYGSLNPFRFYRDPYTWEQGNPGLRPQYTHAVSITQSIKRMYHFIISGQVNTDVMSELPILDADSAVTIYTTGNVDNSYNAAFTGIIPIKILGIWQSNNTLLLSYSYFRTRQNNLSVVNRQLLPQLQSNHTILLPGNLRLEANFLFRGSAALGLYHIKPITRVDIGVRKSLFNQKLDLAFNVSDVFRTSRLRFTTDIGGNINEFDQYVRTQIFTFSLRYSFSRGLKVEEKRRNNSLEELNRAGGG